MAEIATLPRILFIKEHIRCVSRNPQFWSTVPPKKHSQFQVQFRVRRSNATLPDRTPNLNVRFGSTLHRTLNLNLASGSVRFRPEPQPEPPFNWPEPRTEPAELHHSPGHQQPASLDAATAPKRRYLDCQVEHTKQWRKHPEHPGYLCNACGQHHAKHKSPQTLQTIRRERARANDKYAATVLMRPSSPPEKRGGGDYAGSLEAASRSLKQFNG
ncbi:hypothetical protein B0H11DRAFT_2321573 [Mycena galericulata]|nr:hypothetical protein B0H11DRAFT_2321573 [Mycena galericulata]